MTEQITSQNNLIVLRKKWAGTAFLQILVLSAAALVMTSWWGFVPALQWLSLSAFSSLVFFGILYHWLDLNYDREKGRLWPEFGPGNQLTIVRGMLLMLLVGFLFSPRPQGGLAYLPGFLYSSAALADLFDGYLARISGHQSRLGEKLDLNLDGFGILVASLLLVQYGQVPPWYLLVGLARYLFIVGIWLRRKLGKPVFSLTDNSVRRPFAGAQMGFAAVVLFPVFSPPGTFLAAAVFALPFLLGFIFDWFLVCGISPFNLFRPETLPNSADYFFSSSWFKAVSRLTRNWVPVMLRVALVILILAWIQARLISPDSSPTVNVAESMLAALPPGQWSMMVLLLMFSSLVLTAAGIAGRTAAIFILFAVGIYLEFFQLNWIEVLLVWSAVSLFYLGTGPYSLWTPESKVITQRLGES